VKRRKRGDTNENDVRGGLTEAHIIAFSERELYTRVTCGDIGSWNIHLKVAGEVVRGGMLLLAQGSDNDRIIGRGEHVDFPLQVYESAGRGELGRRRMKEGGERNWRRS